MASAAGKAAKRLIVRFDKKMALDPALAAHPPLYESARPWWIKYSWLFAGASLFSSFTMAEASWTQWKRAADPDDPEDAKTGEEWLPQPTWMRLGLGGFQLCAGLGLTALIIALQSRVVRRVRVIPPGVAPTLGNVAEKRLLLQSALDYSRASIIPFSAARLYPGRDDTELVINADGFRGNLWLGTKNAVVDGQAGKTPGEVREALMAVWGIKKGDTVHIPENTSAKAKLAKSAV